MTPQQSWLSASEHIELSRKAHGGEEFCGTDDDQ